MHAGEAILNLAPVMSAVHGQIEYDPGQAAFQSLSQVYSDKRPHGRRIDVALLNARPSFLQRPIQALSTSLELAAGVLWSDSRLKPVDIRTGRY